MKSTEDFSVQKLKYELDEAEAVVIGAGAGLSVSAGYTYRGERFRRYFSDFEEKYGIEDMYSGGFYPFSSLEEYWAYWSRYIYINRYTDTPNPVYNKLLELIKDKEYFVITTNVDHCFQKAGIDNERLFCTQGDYGLFQCSEPCHMAVYENKYTVCKMVEAQGYVTDEKGELTVPEGMTPKMIVPAELVPYCPKCGKPMTMNLRADDRFVEDEVWYSASERYKNFLKAKADKRILFMELGVGYNTPGIVKFSFWRMTAENPKAVYACINLGEACVPKEIEDRSVCINGDIGQILNEI